MRSPDASRAALLAAMGVASPTSPRRWSCASRRSAALAAYTCRRTGARGNLAPIAIDADAPGRRGADAAALDACVRNRARESRGRRSRPRGLRDAGGRREVRRRALGACCLRLASCHRPGYHRLSILRSERRRPQRRMTLIVVPPRCYQPAAGRQRRRRWGSAVQLYACVRERNWGIGDFTDLRPPAGHRGARSAPASWA